MGRGECAERDYECVETVHVSKGVCSEMRVCCGCGFMSPQKVEWENLEVTPCVLGVVAK